MPASPFRFRRDQHTSGELFVHSRHEPPLAAVNATLAARLAGLGLGLDSAVNSTSLTQGLCPKVRFHFALSEARIRTF
jgi:hypothetical protein